MMQNLTLSDLKNAHTNWQLPAGSWINDPTKWPELYCSVSFAGSLQNVSVTGVFPALQLINLRLLERSNLAIAIHACVSFVVTVNVMVHKQDD